MSTTAIVRTIVFILISFNEADKIMYKDMKAREEAQKSKE